jgi:lysophospholipid acyltransferase (LPLAT)-like uncharacterized protein
VPDLKKKRKRLISRDTEQWLAHGVGVPAAYHVINAIKKTWKIERIHEERAKLKPSIFAIYHGDLLVGAYELPRLLPEVDVLTSRSRDGSLVARFVHMFKGARTIRGGSSKGGTGALLQMRRAVLRGRAVVIPVDGPRGPEGVVKPGVIAVASQSGAPIVPGAVLCERAWRFPSWDRMMVCKPFARVRIVYGEPFHVPPDLERAELEAKRAELEEIMRRMHADQGPVTGAA